MALLSRSRGCALALLAAAAAALSGCLQADALGDEPPDEVAVGTPPRWDNGVAALMNLKCAVCHQVPPPDVAPQHTPTGFDLRYHITAPSGLPGAIAILPALTGGVLRGEYGGAPRMPPDYATPLTPAEQDALETWAVNGGP